MPSDEKKYLGIDYGTVRVGLATAKTHTKIASPLTTLQGSDDFLPVLKQIIQEQNIGLIVVGLPRNLEGDDTPQTELARQFARSLEQFGLPVALQDEAGTSSLARDRIGPKAVSKGQIDAEAAAIILQDYLDNLPVNAQ